MAAKSKDVGRIGVLSVVGFVVLLAFWFVYHSNFMVGRALLLAYPEWDVEYKGALPRFTGKVVAKGVVMIPPWGERTDAVTFDRIVVDVPMWQWYRSAFSELFGKLFKLRFLRGGTESAIRNVRIELENGRGIGGIGYSHELAVVGLFSASPFEAEGCRGDTHWTRDELGDLGLAAGPTRVTVELHDRGDQREVIQRIETPGVGLAEYRGLVSTPDGAGVFSLEAGERDAMASDAWRFVDAGFVAARNRHCAAESDVDPDEFVRRHVLAVERLLAVVGLGADPRLRRAYREFAEHGGEFSYAVDYTPPIGFDLLEDEDLTRWLPRMRGGLVRNGQPAGLGLVAVPVQPLPETDDWDTTYELLVREGTLDPLHGRRPVAPAPTVAAPARIITPAVMQPVADAAPPPRLGYAETLARAGAKVRLFTSNARPRVVEVLSAENGVLQVRWRVMGGAYDYQVGADRFVGAEPVR